MKDSLLHETDNLKFAWASKTPEKLRSYLVSGTQDPRLNIQSTLTRHFLIRQLFGAQFAPLQEQELEHAVRLNEERVRERGPSDAMRNEFVARWQATLAAAQAPTLSVLEAACGSANDYRYFDAYGIARFLDYSGFDLSEANIANARAMFPRIDFQVGNVFDIPRADASVDFVLAFDLFEHLSPEGVERAIDELCRVARRGLVLGLFNAEDTAEHFFNAVPERRYYWSTLSLKQFLAPVAAKSRAIEVVHIKGMLFSKYRQFGSYDAYLDDVNPNLYNVFVSK